VALALVLGLVCAKAAFDVVARTRNPAAIIAATIVNNFVVLMIYISTFFYSMLLYKNNVYNSSISVGYGPSLQEIEQMERQQSQAYESL
jgi:hypothetical protein